MLKTKVHILILFFSLFINTPSSGQRSHLEKKISEIDSILYTHQGQKAIPILDSLLKKKLPINTELYLKAFKIKALVQVDRYESALILSKQIINNQNLKGVPLIRTYIETALLNEIAEEFEESKKYLDFVEKYYANPKVAKDELYGEYLYRRSSWYSVQLLDQKSNQYAEMARVYGKANHYENVEATALMILGVSKIDATKIYSAQSVKNFKRALKLWKNTNNYSHMEIMYSFLAENFRKNKDYINAHKYNDSSIISARKTNHNEGLAINLSAKSKLYELEGDYKKSLFFLRKSKSALDISLIKDQSLKVSEINTINPTAIKRDILRLHI